MKKLMMLILGLTFILLANSAFSARLPFRGETNWDVAFEKLWNISHTGNGTLKAGINASFYDLNITNTLIGKDANFTNLNVSQNLIVLGNIGIGTPPTHKFHIIGNINATGSINATRIEANEILVNGFIVNRSIDLTPYQMISNVSKLPFSNFQLSNVSNNTLVKGDNATLALWNISGSNIFPREISGNVGIGTNSPSVKLVVIGKVNISDSLNVTNTVQATTFIGDGSLLTGISAGGTSVWNSSGNKVYLNDSTGKVGIGLRPSPNNKLEVSGNVNITGSGVLIVPLGSASAPSITSHGLTLTPGQTGIYFLDYSPTTIAISTGGAQRVAIDSNYMVTGTVTGSPLMRTSNPSSTTPAFSFNSDEDTGIWRSAIDTLEFIAGAIEFLKFEESTTDTAIFNDDANPINFRIEGNTEPNLVWVDGINQNNISFFGGYADTGFTFNNSGGLRMSGDLIIDGTCFSQGADCNADIAEKMHSKASFGNTTCNVNPEHQETITHKYYNTTQEECSYQLIGSFYEYICNNISIKVRYNNESEFCFDNFKLIEGNPNKYNKITECQNNSATYTENELRTIPEKVTCSLNQNFNLEFESGDVVCSDETNPLHIKLCDKQYDTSVIGVVNYEATMILNQRAPYPVSIAGNIPVKVKCDTPISIGDLLVSSATAGYAQSIKTTIPTTLTQVWNNIGSPFAKALESCNSGTATIRAMLN